MEAVEIRPPDQPDPSGGAASTLGIAPPEPELPTTDFVTCYELHYGRLVRALLLAGADRSTAEDVAQEAFARALVHWWRVKRGPNPPGYVYRAGFRLFDKARRRLGHDNVAEGAAEAMRPLTPGSDPTGSTATSGVALTAVLAGMPPRRRACAVMCLVVGLPVAEVGEALGIAGGTVRKHLEEAKKDLASVLG